MLPEYRLSDLTCRRCKSTADTLYTQTPITENRRSDWAFIDGDLVEEVVYENAAEEGIRQLVCLNCSPRQGVLIEDFCPEDLADCKNQADAQATLDQMIQNAGTTA